MNIQGKHWRSIWLEMGGESVAVIDQTKLPHSLKIRSLKTFKDVVKAISKMVVRGAPLIGITGAYGLMLALIDDPSDRSLEKASMELISTRPTAINLKFSIQRVLTRVMPLPLDQRADAARLEAELILNEEINMCKSIGDHGLKIIRKIFSDRPAKLKNEPINIMTHCNAGWLATGDWGTALAPIYKAHRLGMNIHVWVNETRPRNQGANLTTFELSCERIPNTLIVDNAGGYLMQKGKVDVIFVGADRITMTGDVCNKIGTYLKALAASDNKIPFYVAAPFTTIDWDISKGLKEIPIEERSQEEVTYVQGKLFPYVVSKVGICSSKVVAFNPAFDITPAHLISGLITERGIACPSKDGLKELYPDHKLSI